MTRVVTMAMTLVMLLGGAALMAQQTPHRVVVEVTTGDAAQWEGILNNVENLRQALAATTEVEVVAHGKGLAMLLATNTAMQSRLERLAREGVVFAACENTMRRQRVDKDDLASPVTTVDSGVAEVVRKQEAGWSYLKGGS